MSLFARVADIYGHARPAFPASFYRELLNFVPDPALGEALHLWDCATGPHATVSLGLATALGTSHFSHTPTTIHATDIDQNAIGLAKDAFQSRSNGSAGQKIDVLFSKSAAELGPLTLPDAAKLSLTAVGNAAHWFDLPTFYAAVHQQSKTDGILAVWTHRLEPHVAEHPALEQILWNLNARLRYLEHPASRDYVTGGYANLPFPFSDQLSLSDHLISADMTMDRVTDYYASIFSLQQTIAQRVHFKRFVASRMKDHWVCPDRPMRLTWRLDLRAGRTGSYEGAA